MFRQVSFAALVVGVFFATSATPKSYVDDEIGFEIEIPNGWHVMTTEDLRMFQQFLDSIGEKSRYVAGFSSSPVGADVAPPYLLIQWSRYKDLDIKGQATSQDVRTMAAPILNGNALDAFERRYRVNLADSGISATEESHRLQPGLDLASKRLLYGVEIAAPLRHVYCVSLTEYGQFGWVQALYYASEASVYDSNSAGMQTIQTLALNESARWKPHLDRQGSAYHPPGPLRRLLLGAAIGAVIGALATAVAAFLLKRHRSNRVKP